MPDPCTWSAETDALAAAPEHHTLVFENDRVRVLETFVRPGDIVPVHTHRWPAVIHMLSAGDFVRRSGTGEVLLDTRLITSKESPTAVWCPPLDLHTFENVGSTNIHALVVEIKQA